MKSPTLILLALTWVFSGLASGQGLTPAQRKVWDAFTEAKELRDVKAMENIARRSKAEMNGIFDSFSWDMSYNDSLDAWDKLKSVGRALDDAQGGNYHRVQMKMLEGLTLEDRQKRGEHWNAYIGLRSTIQTAVKEKDKAAINEAAPGLQELAIKFQGLKDAVAQSYCLVEVAKAMEANDEQLEAVKVYDAIDQALSGAGLQSFPFQGAVRSSRDSLIKQGYDPNAKPGDKPVGPAGNSATSWSKDPAGQKWSDPVQLKLVVDPKVTGVVTPNPANSINTVRWKKHQFSGSKPNPFDPDFQPMGMKFSLRRDGVKVFLKDGEDEREREIKMLSKPNIVEMNKTYKDWDGNEQKLKYAWLAATGGEESIFGFDVNSAPQINGPMTVRYASGCYLRGNVLGKDLRIYDDNSSGRFGDPQRVKDGLSTWEPIFQANDAMIFGKQKTAGPWTEFINVDDEFYRLRLDPENYTVITRKLDVDTGTLKLSANKIKPSVVIAEEIGELKGAFFLLDPKKPITVPVGRYRLSYGVVRKGSGKNEDTCEIFPPESGSVEVKKDEESVIEIGAPFRFDFNVDKTSDGLKIIGRSVVIFGRSGEMYTRFFDDPPIPDKVSVKGAGKPQKMKKAVFDDYRNDGRSAWFPLDLNVTAKPGREYTVTVEIKKNKLFGGKISSEPKKIKL